MATNLFTNSPTKCYIFFSTTISILRSVCRLGSDLEMGRSYYNIRGSLLLAYAVISYNVDFARKGTRIVFEPTFKYAIITVTITIQRNLVSEFGTEKSHRLAPFASSRNNSGYCSINWFVVFIWIAPPLSNVEKEILSKRLPRN